MTAGKPAMVRYQDEIEPDLRERLERLPPVRQQAALALSGGAGPTRAAGYCGVTDRTVRRWMEDPEFFTLVRELGVTIGADLIRVAIAALFEIIEKDAEKGEGRNVRWFLSRTVFADFERSRVAARGPAIVFNVSQSQAITETNAAIANIWNERIQQASDHPGPTSL